MDTPTPAAPLPSSAGAVDIAVNAEVAAAPQSEVARELLRQQTQLLHQQTSLARNEGFRNRIKAVRDIALSVLVLVILAGTATTLWRASQASGLVVEPFSVPTAQSGNGMDGTVLASHLLDRLQTMQMATDSSRASSNYSNNWSNGLSIKVPQTGLSVSEIWTMLRRLLGKETFLTGDLIERDGTLILTARFGDQESLTVSGPTDALPDLLDQMAAAIYRQAQPYRYSVWLKIRDQPGADQILRELSGSNDRTEQLWGLVGRSGVALDTDAKLALALAQDALRLDPSFNKARLNVIDALAALGWEEAILQEYRLIVAELRTYDPRVTTVSQDRAMLSSKAEMAMALKDYETALSITARNRDQPEYSGHAMRARFDYVRSLIGLHAVQEARDEISRLERTSNTQTGYHFLILAHLYLETGELDPRLAEIKSVVANTRLTAYPIRFRSVIAEAALASGDAETARLVMQGTDPDCYQCHSFMAKVALGEGKPEEAMARLIRANQLAPSLPDGWLDLGQLHLARGRNEDALEAFEEASRRAPKWADPHKAAGDALMAAGEVRKAERRYRLASQKAPRWGGAYLAWAEALTALGKTRQADQKYREASQRFLTAAEMSRLQSRHRNPTQNS